MKILVVDDNRDIVDGLALILRDEAHHVDVAYDASALSLISSQQYQLILLDLKLPDINGLELYGSASTQQKNAEIYLMTAYRLEQIISNYLGYQDVYSLFQPTKVEDVISLSNKADVLIVNTDNPNLIHSVADTLNKHHNTVSVISDLDDFPQTGTKDILLLSIQSPIPKTLSHLHIQKKHGGVLPEKLIMFHQKQDATTTPSEQEYKEHGLIYKPFSISMICQMIDEMTSRMPHDRTN